MTVKFDGLTMNQLAERNAELHMNLAALTVENTELQGKLKRAESAIATGLESIDNSLHVLRVETARSNQLAVENSALKEALEHVINPDNQPEYHDQGMGCGVEDHGYQRNGYAACYYGWESAMERVYSEVIPDSMPVTPITDAALAAVRARSPLPLDQLPVDEDFWSAVLDIFYQTETGDPWNIQLGSGDAKSLALWFSDVLPLRKELIRS